MKVNVVNHGDIYDVYVDGEHAGYARVHHGWDSDVDSAIPSTATHSAWFTMNPKFRRTGVAKLAYRLIVEHERLNGKTWIYGIPLTPISKKFMRKVGFKSMGEKIAISVAQREGAEPPATRMRLRIKRMFE